ncbi:winged helix-turn-helix transcriptional regulator [Paenibacillus sp. 1001270B_150601_E10]|uniref:winged helix-turn-helix transcriptional regulator n=1 Tax=Paenibacillus sp. 1001270B_150601_E10 TaxID=2787079 RepID=UPI00189F683F|nr:helix-turn-helix domain-containing protein [Paenibacillus sp. 1001270B_150601_E10]
MKNDIPALCPRFEKAIELLSKRWAALIIYQLMTGPQRFAHIEQSLPNLSSKVLSDRLKELEHEGLIRRDVYPETPVRIEYSLTEKGRALSPLFDDIASWATKWIQLPQDTKAAEDLNT